MKTEYKNKVYTSDCENFEAVDQYEPGELHIRIKDPAYMIKNNYFDVYKKYIKNLITFLQQLDEEFNK